MIRPNRRQMSMMLTPRRRSASRPFTILCHHNIRGVAVAWIVISLLATTGLVSSVARGQVATSSPKTIVTTIHPFHEMIEAIGGPSVNVYTLLPPGASPHTYEPRPGDVRAAAEAALFVSVGAGLDDWAANIADAAGQHGRTVVLAERVWRHGAARDQDDVMIAVDTKNTEDFASETRMDPHFWLDPIVMRDVVAPAIAAELQSLFPGDHDDIAHRLAVYQQKLTDLDSYVRAQFAQITHRRFIAYHSAWRYFSARYGLEEIGTVTPFPGQEPSARWVAELVRFARTVSVDVVVAEPQLNPQAATTMARELKGTVITLDPIGGEGVKGAAGYVEMMRTNAERLAAALGGKP